MQRRYMNSLLLGGLALAAVGCTGVTDTRSGSTEIAGLSGRAAREIARANNMITQRPLTPAARNSLQRGDPVPADISFQAMPDRMQRQLPEIEGHEWRAAGIDLVLIHTESNIVADILRGPLR